LCKYSPSLKSSKIVVKDYFKQIGPEFHDIARAEGLISGIAVPVQIGQTNFGVLLTFNRTETQFSKIELDTLSLFGNFAAVEITRKRAQERLQESEKKYRSLYAESKRREELYGSFLNSSLEPIETDIIDPRMLWRILQTLVKNAVENSPDEAQVIISLSKISSDILLRVEDHGIGIPASDREFIFKAFHHTQETDQYSTKKPFDFNAGGKGLELMHLNILAEQGAFDISYESNRCRYIPTHLDQCCGKVSICQHISDLEGCKQSGGTIFSV
jgi:signal transduction histidine kinase